jgi:hypothetical protein
LGSGARWSGSTTGRYRDEKPEFKTRGFYLEVVMDHRQIPELLASLVNADWPVNILRVQESDYKDENLSDAGAGGEGLSSMGSRSMGGTGAGAMGGRSAAAMMRSGGGGPPGMKGSGASPRGGGARVSEESIEGSSSNRSPLDDPNLSNVAIVGVIYIFNKPVEKPGAASPTPSAPPTSSPAAISPVATAPAAGAPAAGDVSNAAAPAAEVKSETADVDDAKDDAKAGDSKAGDSKTVQPEPAAAVPEDKPADKPQDNTGKKSAEGDSSVKAGVPEKAAPEKAGKS